MVLTSCSYHVSNSIAWHSSMSSNSNYALSAAHTLVSLLLNIPYVNAWNAFARTLCLCRDSWCSIPTQSGRAQHSPIGLFPQTQWRTRSSEGSETRMGLASLDGTATQSFPPMPG